MEDKKVDERSEGEAGGELALSPTEMETNAALSDALTNEEQVMEIEDSIEMSMEYYVICDACRGVTDVAGTSRTAIDSISTVHRASTASSWQHWKQIDFRKGD